MADEYGENYEVKFPPGISCRKLSRYIRLMRIHMQRKYIDLSENSEADLKAVHEAFDERPDAAAGSAHVAALPDGDGMWLVIVQQTRLPLEQVRIFPGFTPVPLETVH